MAVFILHTKHAQQRVHVSITQTSRILKSNGGTEHQTHKRASEQIYTTINKKQTHRIIEVHYYSCNPYSKLIAHWKLSNLSFTPNNPRSKMYFG